MQHDKLITVKEAARRMSCTDQTIRKWIQHGHRGRRLEAKQVGHRWFTTPEALDAFVNGKSHQVATVENNSISEDAARFGLV